MVKNLHVQLDDELFKELKVKCAVQGVKVSQVVRKLIKQWVEDSNA
ncbi:MAG: plasmid partition protein ParG [Candidatus Nezhaarchaeota archaeon]|nr:plasmid partition protein ParG [Candidatus Nezhaarchaeota archaeon]